MASLPTRIMMLAGAAHGFVLNAPLLQQQQAAVQLLQQQQPHADVFMMASKTGSRRFEAVKEQGTRMVPPGEGGAVKKRSAAGSPDRRLHGNLNPAQYNASRSVRRSVPHGTGNDVRVAVLRRRGGGCAAAGADLVGFDDLIETMPVAPSTLMCCSRPPACPASDSARCSAQG